MVIVKFRQWNCNLEFAKYSNGRTAILLSDVEDGSPVAKATVNIPEIPLSENEVIIKDYAENIGMLETLINAGVVEDTQKKVAAGRVSVPIVKLLIPIK